MLLKELNVNFFYLIIFGLGIKDHNKRALRKSARRKMVYHAVQHYFYHNY